MLDGPDALATLLKNEEPVDPNDGPYRSLFQRLQGNIVKSHGRNNTANLFLQFTVRGGELRGVLRELTERFVISAAAQNDLAAEYRKRVAEHRKRVAAAAGAGVPPPGVLQPTPGISDTPFGTLLLRPTTYEKLDYERAKLLEMFRDLPADAEPNTPEKSTFVGSMLDAGEELGDAIDQSGLLQPLEQAYLEGSIDALLLLANDDYPKLRDTVEALRSELAQRGIARIVALEWGHVLRDAQDRRIEPFGYVDGVSQPLFLTSDFEDLPAPTAWDPFAPLSLVLFKDPGARDALACGSYYVFRKLEQDVPTFLAAEAEIASDLGLADTEPERAGAMLVGRFRDGTPLVLSRTAKGLKIPENDFRYDGLDTGLQRHEPLDRLGLKCPFHAHIRKMSPRQSVNREDDTADAITKAEDSDRSHSIVRRGIPYGTSPLSSPPDRSASGGVGLLFACYQRSIMGQFAFLQKRWANHTTFKIPGGVYDKFTGLDPIIGRPLFDSKLLPQRWRAEYGGTAEDYPVALDDVRLDHTHTVKRRTKDFVRFRGGEFFFAPSRAFLLGET